MQGVMAHRHYFVGRKITVRSDSITSSWIKQLKRAKNSKLFRWGLWLDSIKNIHFQHIEGRLNKVADYLSRRPYDGEAPAPTEFASQILEEDISIISKSPTQDSANESLQGVDCLKAENDIFAEDCDSESDNGATGVAKYPEGEDLLQAYNCCY